MLGKDIFKLYSKFNSLFETLQYASKSQPSAEFQKKFGTQSELFIKLIQDELKGLTSDPAWNQAKLLSEKVKREQKLKQTGNLKEHNVNIGAKRSFSTYSRLHQENNNKDQVCNCESIPTNKLSRMFHYTSLAADVSLSAAFQGAKQMYKGQKPTMKSLIFTEENITKIAKKFRRMRGAALKVGQMLSFQDEKVLPNDLFKILQKVQSESYIIPRQHFDKLMVKQFNSKHWDSEKFQSFDKMPIASASIGQVHFATLPNNEKVAVKVQFPGVKECIDSDLNSLVMFLTASSLLPKGLFLEKTIENARTELGWECDYNREANCIDRFGALLKDDPVFKVPKVYKELTTDMVLTMERMDGLEIMKYAESASQEWKDFVCTEIMRLCLQEIAQHRYMQTDPNWANFLYNEKTNKIELIDFGATREYPEEFIYNYRNLLTSAVKKDRTKCQEYSETLGYLLGLESQQMVDAHVDSVLVLGEPFAQPGLFDFKNQTVTDRIRGNISVMINERLTPPPEETYSLHRKFSGVFLLCAKMGAKVPCHDLFQKYFAI
ncbi:Ubiquinone biosynthesis [Hanseniaspora guilliermondii]